MSNTLARLDRGGCGRAWSGPHPPDGTPDLQKADLTGADLRGADLRGAAVEATQLQSAITDKQTIPLGSVEP
jgi:uncharacterized protein YjbI with pentapeptide repeats